MRGRCWNCERFEEHFFWEHVEETRFRFLKLMEGDFFHRMEFPRKFVRNFRVNLPDLITLVDRNGELHKVRLAKEEDRVYFKDGWKEFIDDHGVKEGYVVVFKYSGSSSFTVEIFDQNGRLRDTFNFKKGARKRAEEAVGNLKRSRFPSVEVLSSSRFACDDNVVIVISDGEEESDVKLAKIEWNGMSRSNLHRKSRSGPVERMEKSKEIIKILQHSYQNQLKSSFFVKPMLKSHLDLRPFMVIPTDFVSKHLHKKPKTILCQVSGKQWVLCCKLVSSCFGFRGKSLQQFVQDNRLEEGDACVFVLISSTKNVVMDAIIVRAADIHSMR